MIVLESGSTSQTFRFIPREYTDSIEQIYNVSIFSESENKEVYSQDTATFGSNDYYKNYTGIFNLLEDNFYILTIKKNSDIIFKDKVFCTNQLAQQPEFWNTGDFVWDLNFGTWNTTPQEKKYSVNENNYTKHSSNNEFIIL